MKRKKLLRLIIIVLVCISVLSWIQLIQDYQQFRRSSKYSIIRDIESAIREVDPEMKMTCSIEDQPITYSDKDGNTIIYHCLTTTYYTDRPQNFSGIDMNAIQVIIDPDTTDTCRDCNVNDR